MVETLKIIVSIINSLHDLAMKIFSLTGFNLSDKAQHFFVVAILGMFIYLVTNKLFKFLAKYNIAIISFIYTFTIVIVFVFGVEIQQKITNRGNMEFADITAGLWGFIEAYTIYLFIVFMIGFIKNTIKEYNTMKSKEKSKDKPDIDK